MEESVRQPVRPENAYVLVVEDNVSNFVLTARLLAYIGVKNCEWKTTGWGVVDFAKTMPRVDLVLMDLRLPHEDGYSALEQIRNTPELKDTVVVVVTAHASSEEMQRAREAGFDGFLAKPLDPDRFPEQIRQILQGESVWSLGL
ncbi:MAG: response regulator [Anaerolineales bacterium]|nr:response regulator [Anaerolineales bacterium]MCB0007802.1 response regulator [Anaerolineales bacterium]MCB0010324.1 response regulator [Anaerolineales bacterium]MCB0030232.1 response regulator [Anaerolineales bacterium]MCB8959553.1 response regulator [Ardenticatenales bacterium]